MSKNFKVIENNDFDSSSTTEDYNLALRYHFEAGNLSRFEQKRDELMDNGKLHVVNETDMPDRLFTEEDISLALDYGFNRRPLDEFEVKRAKKEHEKLNDLFDYVQSTPLY